MYTLQTPVATRSYKNVVHRAFMTNVRLRPGHPEEWACRCCRTDKESIQHFAKCPSLSPLWQKVGTLAQADVTTELVLFGLTSDRKTVPEGISALLMLVWKFTLIQLTSASMNDTRVNTDIIWESAIARLRRKIKPTDHTVLESVQTCGRFTSSSFPSPSRFPLNHLFDLCFSLKSLFEFLLSYLVEIRAD